MSRATAALLLAAEGAAAPNSVAMEGMVVQLVAAVCVAVGVLVTIETMLVPTCLKVAKTVASATVDGSGAVWQPWALWCLGQPLQP